MGWINVPTPRGSDVETVIAAIDGSPASWSVIEAARLVAASLHADIEALHVRNGAGQGLIVGPAGGLPVRITTGDPETAIVDAAARDAVVMVVLGVGVHPGVGPGHVAAAVLQRLTKPVIVVPANYTRPAAGIPLRVLVAVDGTAATASAAPDAARFVGATELIALHVFTAATAPLYWDRPYYDYPNSCREFVHRHCHGTTVRVEFRQGDVAGNIIDVASARGVSLVALPWSRDLSPGRASIVTHVLANSSIPVLLFPAAAPGDVRSARPAPQAARGRGDARRARHSREPATLLSTGAGASAARSSRHSGRRTVADGSPGNAADGAPRQPAHVERVTGGNHPLVGQVGPCPACGGNLRATFDGEMSNFLCGTCGTCWHAELGWLHRVDPSTCPGCPSRDACGRARRPYGGEDHATPRTVDH